MNFTPLRNIDGRFMKKHKLKSLREYGIFGRKRKVGICNCCLTQHIPLDRYYCDNCREFIRHMRSQMQRKISSLQSKISRYKLLYNKKNPGQIRQILNTYSKYKSSSDHYRIKAQRILEAYNELKIQLESQGLEAPTFKIQKNSIATPIEVLKT